MTENKKPQRQHWARGHRILAGALIGLIVIAAGLLLAQDKVTLQIKSSIAVEDSRFPQYVADLLGHRLTSSDAFIVHTNGDRAFPAMIHAIEVARQRVDLESYIYEKGTVGTRFTDALEAAARRGVKVRMVLDAVGSKGMADDDIKRLETAGAHIGWVNPVASYHVDETNYRNHRKALVVDGAVAFVGGMGIADHWARDATNDPMWRDTQIELHGPVVTDLEAAFNQNWMLTGGIVDPEVRPSDALASGSSRSIVIWSSRQGGANELKLLYLLSLGAARHSIDIESPYLVLDESSKWSIHEARRRGVHIRLLVEGDKTDAKAVKFASRSEYESLLEDGVEIAEYQPTMLHTKAMVIDGMLSVFGSANFDNRSLEMNDELNVVVFDRALAGRLLQDFEKDLDSSKKLDLDTWRDRAMPEKARDWFWSYFGEVF